MQRIFNVLTKTIPSGGFGRNLTSHECRKIRKAGLSCSPRWIVVSSFDSESVGILYYPSRQSGFDKARVLVTM